MQLKIISRPNFTHGIPPNSANFYLRQKFNSYLTVFLCHLKVTDDFAFYAHFKQLIRTI